MVGRLCGCVLIRCVVERAFAWLHQFKLLRIRYERRADLHQGLLELACSVICGDDPEESPLPGSVTKASLGPVDAQPAVLEHL